MKVLLKNLGYPALIIFAVVLVNIFVYYTTVCTAETVQSRDIYGGSHSAERAAINARRELTASLSGEHRRDISELSARVELLEDYKAAAEYVTDRNYGSLSRWEELPAEERRARAEELYEQSLREFPSEERLLVSISDEISVLNEMIGYLKYLTGYNDYVKNIAERSDFLSDISIYNENSGIVGNIVKTQKDFYGLSNITLTPVTEDGFTVFLSFRVSDFLAVLITLISLAALSFGNAERPRSALAAPVLLSAAGITALYLGNYILTDMFLGMPQTDAAVQSMESFKSCPYPISAGFLAVCTVFAKLCGCMVILLSAAALISAQGKRRVVSSALLAAVAAAELALAVTDSPDFLREINLLSFFSLERFFIRYLNLELFGLAVSRLPVFAAFAAAAVVIAAIAAARGVSSRAAQLTRESERRYYDEINRRYMESRRIRHDINNHLLAISALIETGNIEQAKRYITEVSEQTDLAAMPVRTGSQVLDALLFKKTEQAAERGIALTFEVSCPLSDCGISDYDLCTVFGNILDNALEASAQGDKISVAIGNQLDMLYISCENPFTGELRRRGDRILTSKRDASSHGYGLPRVREIAARCGGEVKITAENGVFLIEILMNTK